MWRLFFLTLCAMVFSALALRGEEPPQKPPAAAASQPGDPPGVRLQPNAAAWVDRKGKRVIIDGKICRRTGMLEMLVCQKGTKEHESIVAVEVPAQVIHAALVAIGAEPGSPVQFQPTFKAPTGAEIAIHSIWTDAQQQVHYDRAQDWVRDIKTKEVMKAPWVFAGSGFYTDEETHQRYYQAEGGYFVCLSNFPSAMIDVGVKSSSEAADLAYEAFTDHIPQVGTKVRLVFSLAQASKEAAKPAEEKPTKAKQSSEADTPTGKTSAEAAK